MLYALSMDIGCAFGLGLAGKFKAAWPHLDERARRIMAASEAMSLGHGGVSIVSRACGLSRNVIHKGIGEIQQGVTLPVGRVRRVGAGRKSIAGTDPGIVAAIDALMDGSTRGDPQSPLRWTHKLFVCHLVFWLFVNFGGFLSSNGEVEFT